MIIVHTKKITELDPSEENAIRASLSCEAIERLNKKRSKDLYLASLSALSLLTEEERNDLSYTKNGAPFFKTLNKDLSITHSKSLAAVAISDSKSISVGIDVENATQSSPTRFLTNGEKKELESGTTYVTIWTKKEALFKFLKNDSLILSKTDSSTPEKYGITFKTVELENAILSVCAPENEEIEIIQK
jgi:phosphopantetheinyl transferase